MNAEPYVRETDGALMVPIAPHQFVNAEVLKRLQQRGSEEER